MSWMQAIGQGIDKVIGIGTDALQNHRNRRNTEDAIGWHEGASKRLAEFNKEQQLDLWNKTNVGAQMEHMRKAGLNIGLMYGQGGGSGVTGGVSPMSSGGVPGAQSSHKEGMGLALAQIEQMQAQKDLIKAQTENVKTDTENKGGVEREKTGTEVKEIATRTGVNEEMVRKIIQEQELMKAQKTAISEKTPEEVEKLKSETKLNKAKEVAQIIDNAWKGKLNEAQIQMVHAKINEISAKLAFEWRRLSQEDKKIKIDKFMKEWQSNNPSIMNVVGNGAAVILRAVEAMIGDKEGRQKLENKVE